MTNIECPKGCKQVLLSEKKLALHLALVHESYEDGRDIGLATIRSLEKVSDRTFFLMLKFPQCRSIKNGALFAKYIQYFIGTIVWDNIKGGYTPRNGNSIPYLEWELTLSQLESVRREREDLQAKDRKNYHADDGSMLYGHRCILPNEKDQAVAEVLERTKRSYYGRAGNIGGFNG